MLKNWVHDIWKISVFIHAGVSLFITSVSVLHADVAILHADVAVVLAVMFTHAWQWENEPTLSLCYLIKCRCMINETTVKGKNVLWGIFHYF